MIGPGPRNAITDVPGVRVGSAEDAEVRTGVTVILPDEPAVAAVDIRGGGTGTREVALLDPDGTVEAVDALVLSGGSAFGLSAADGVMTWLAAQRRGFRMHTMHVPIVPTAILFDLLNGGDKTAFADPVEDRLPYRDLARRAASDARHEVGLGNAGAGYGAISGHLKGGQGTASLLTGRGIAIGALAVVNSFGSAVATVEGHFWAGALEHGDEFGGRGGPPRLADYDYPFDKYDRAAIGANTTLAVVATDAILDRRQARRIAVMAQDGLARAIRPAHAPFDGDVVFVLSTGWRTLGDPLRDVALLGMLAGDCVARAVARGVHAAEGLDEWPGYAAVFGTGPRT